MSLYMYKYENMTIYCMHINKKNECRLVANNNICFLVLFCVNIVFNLKRKQAYICVVPRSIHVDIGEQIRLCLWSFFRPSPRRSRARLHPRRSGGSASRHPPTGDHGAMSNLWSDIKSLFLKKPIYCNNKVTIFTHRTS